MEAKNFNEVIKNAKKAFNQGIKNPLKVVNMLNSSAFKNDPEIKEALKAIGANKWHMDLCPKSFNGKVCKLGKAYKFGQLEDLSQWELEAIFAGDNSDLAIVDGVLYACKELQAVTGPQFIDLCKQLAKIRMNAAQVAAKKAEKERQEAEKKAEKEAKKAEKKAASKKAKTVKVDLSELEEFQAWKALQEKNKEALRA